MFTLWIVLHSNQSSIPTSLTYYPIDEKNQITESSTSILLKDNIQTPSIEWSVTSSSNIPVYLRQDVGLLYKNGRLKGIMSKWKENERDISQMSAFDHHQDALYESLSFHYGERHTDSKSINSFHTLTHDQAFVYSINQKYQSFKEPKNQTEKHIQTLVRQDALERLNREWKNLIHHFNINQDEYWAVPLIELTKQEHEYFNTFSEETKTKVIGQLFEGLYKHYIIPFSQDTDHTTSYMPLILISKQLDELLVLFTNVNQEPEMLIQQIHQ
ncbi:hypothetical protein [Pelagirhabdus alkalitolerans]|nr:hypothetical protein [Pelagirhabdus alkalitolerans]